MLTRGLSPIARAFIFAGALWGGSVAALSSASALDPRPTTYRERARHDFRDVQLGLCHPADGTRNPKSVKCNEAPEKTRTTPKK